MLKIEATSALSRAAGGGIDEYASRIIRGTEANRERIDSVLDQHLEGWRLSRLGVLERAILRVAAYELLEEPEVPVAVVVDEAVSLAKRFCSAEAGSLVNGLLGTVAQKTRENHPGLGKTERSDSE